MYQVAGVQVLVLFVGCPVAAWLIWWWSSHQEAGHTRSWTGRAWRSPRDFSWTQPQNLQQNRNIIEKSKDRRSSATKRTSPFVGGVHEESNRGQASPRTTIQRMYQPQEAVQA